MNHRKTGDIAIESPTRRRLLVSTGLAAIPLTALAADGDVISRSAESIHQERLFRASRNRLYDALTDARQFAKIVQLSGAMQSMPAGTTAAEINREVGGSFSIFGGHIVGLQLELVPNQRIVQAWRVVDWKPGDYSIAKFDLSEQGEQTRVVFDHKGISAGRCSPPCVRVGRTLLGTAPQVSRLELKTGTQLLVYGPSGTYLP